MIVISSYADPSQYNRNNHSINAKIQILNRSANPYSTTYYENPHRGLDRYTTDMWTPIVYYLLWAKGNIQGELPWQVFSRRRDRWVYGEAVVQNRGKVRRGAKERGNGGKTHVYRVIMVLAEMTHVIYIGRG